MARLPDTMTGIGLPQQYCEILAMVGYTKSDILPIYQLTVRYFVGISNYILVSAILHLNFISKHIYRGPRPMFWIMGCRTLTVLTTLNTIY